MQLLDHSCTYNTTKATAGSQLHTQHNQGNRWITAAHTTQPRQPLDHSCTHNPANATAGSQLHTQHNQGNRWITAAHTAQPRQPLDHSCTHNTTKATAGSQLYTPHNQQHNQGKTVIEKMDTCHYIRFSYLQLREIVLGVWLVLGF